MRTLITLRRAFLWTSRSEIKIRARDTWIKILIWERDIRFNQWVWRKDIVVKRHLWGKNKRSWGETMSRVREAIWRCSLERSSNEGWNRKVIVVYFWMRFYNKSFKYWSKQLRWDYRKERLDD